MMHEPRPDPKGPSVYGQDLVQLGDAIHPGADLPGLLGVALARDLDASLQLPERHGR
jgi:hypothetical protein